MELLPQYQKTKQVTLESHLITEEYHFSQGQCIFPPTKIQFGTTEVSFLDLCSKT